MANTVTTNDLVNGSVTLEKLGSNVVDAINTKLPLGTIIMSTRLDTPFGFLPCDGGTYTSAQFPEFYALLVGGDFGTKFNTKTLSAWTTEFVANSGYCGYYGLDTANGIFKMPVFGDAFLRSGAVSGVGKYGRDQIVNISGSLSVITYDTTTTPSDTGTFANISTTALNRVPFSGGGGYPNLGTYTHTFDASKQVYTGTQVQPRNISVRAFVQVYHSSENFSVEVKMNPDYTNATYTSVIGTSPATATTINAVAGKKYTGADIVIESWYANDGSAWYRKYASGWLEQGGFKSGLGTVKLFTPFTNTGFNVTATWNQNSNRTAICSTIVVLSKTVSSIVIDRMEYNGGNVYTNFSWMACGY